MVVRGRQTIGRQAKDCQGKHLESEVGAYSSGASQILDKAECVSPLAGSLLTSQSRDCPSRSWRVRQEPTRVEHCKYQARLIMFVPGRLTIGKQEQGLAKQHMVSKALAYRSGASPILHGAKCVSPLAGSLLTSQSRDCPSRRWRVRQEPTRVENCKYQTRSTMVVPGRLTIGKQG